jgi:antitoxin HigA-1
MKEATMYGFIPTHPGDVLKEELKARRYSLGRTAKKFGVGEHYLSLLLEGKAAMKPELAKALEQAWGIPSKTWLELQKRYDTHPKNTHGGKREGAGRKSTGTVSKILRANASKKEMNTIMAWLDKQPNKARAVADALYKQARR